ncbi:hypothetical protein N9B60_00420 [Mariniblastus sp.]|nr:hypothetical protein [Mariniblastus sp.]MDB4458489.1 hypothetical protein [bacterium]MDC3223678.1 hypothetical protein [Mariniblastus sp.]
MSRRSKPRRITNFFGAFLLETAAVVIFLFLFMQARAERQKSSDLERGRFPFIEEIAQQSPFEKLLAHQISASGIERWNCFSISP